MKKKKSYKTTPIGDKARAVHAVQKEARRIIEHRERRRKEKVINSAFYNIARDLRVDIKKLKRWAASFVEEGINPAELIGGRLRKHAPQYRATTQRNRSHIRRPDGMKHNADPVIAAHHGLCDQVTEDLMSWGIPITFDIITAEFTSELARTKGELWVKDPSDAVRDARLRKGVVYRYLHSHKSKKKMKIVKRVRASIKEKSDHEVNKAVYQQQAELKDKLDELRIQSYSQVALHVNSRSIAQLHVLAQVTTYDETFLTRNGNALQHTLSYEGGNASVHKRQSGMSGWMILTVVHYTRVEFVFYKAATKKQWERKGQRYSFTELHPGVFQMLVGPGAQIDRIVHLNCIQRLFKVVREPHIAVADGARPHTSQLIKLAFLSMNIHLCLGKDGGWMSVSQVADSPQIHAAYKRFIKQRAIAYFLSFGRDFKGKKKCSGIRFEQATEWSAMWAREVHPNVPQIFEKYMPPLPLAGSIDKRRSEIHASIQYYLDHKNEYQDDNEENANAKFGFDSRLTDLKGLGAKTEELLKREGIINVRDLIANADESEVRGALRFREQALSIMAGELGDPIAKATFTCELCGQSYKTKASLTMHKTGDRRCFCLLKRPFLPRRADSEDRNDTCDYKNRGFRFMYRGTLTQGMFPTSSHEKMYFLDELKEWKCFEGDYRTIVKSALQWL